MRKGVAGEEVISEKSLKQLQLFLVTDFGLISQ